MPGRRIVHIELPASDRQAIAQFYADLFGWGVSHNEQYQYTSLSLPDEHLGFGLMTPEQEGQQPVPSVYIESSDIPADLEAIKAKGGQPVGEMMAFEGIGRFAFFADPAGSVLALADFDPPPTE